jgi:ketosteroid isomerase-like protein
MQAVPDTTAQTKAVLAHHLQALTAKDLDATLSDYTEESVLFTQNGIFVGLDQLRGFFTEFIKLLTPEFMSNLAIHQEARGDYAYLFFSSGAAVPLGTDTFVLRDGKIIAQTFTVYMPG